MHINHADGIPGKVSAGGSHMVIGGAQSRQRERAMDGDGFLAKMIDALLEAGISPEQIEAAVRVREPTRAPCRSR
jgi:hypothetical protein